jgi:transposase
VVALPSHALAKDKKARHGSVIEFVRAVLEAFGLPVMFLAPYSFKMDAVEKLLSFIKNRDLNPLVARAYSR